MSIYARLAALLVIVAAIAGAWWKFDRMLAAADKTGYERRAGEDKAAADAQAAANRDLQRTAEKHYVVQAEAREHYIVTTTKEIVHDAAPLGSCPVPEPVRVRLDAARGCAVGDSAAACGAGDGLPGAR